MLRFLFVVCALCALRGESRSADPTYWQDVRPILRKHCVVCHSERRLDEPDLSASLALDKPDNIRKGGKGGKVTVLVAGKPDESLIVTLLTAKDKKRAMPLDADPLSADEIAIIRKWVAVGAPEGTKPADGAGTATTAPARPTRKIDVVFSTKATLPRTAKLPGPLELALPVGPLPPVAAVAFSPDGKWLASGVYGRVTIWDLASAKPAKVLTNVLGAVNDLKFSPNGKLLAVAGGQPSARGDLRLFDTTEWKLLHALGGHLDTVSSVSFSGDGSKLVSASFDKTVRLWDVKEAKQLHAYTGHSDFVHAVSLGPDGSWYATASKDRTGRIIDAATGKGLFTLSGTDQEVLAVAVNPTNGQVMAAGLDPLVSWYDPKTAERQRRAGGPGTSTHEIAIDPKGTLVVTAGGDGTIRTLNPKTAAQVKAMQSGSVVFAVAVDADAKRIASGGADGVVKLWDATDARLLVTLWSGADGAWVSLTPEGYVAGQDALLEKASWKATGKTVTDPKLLAPLRDAGQVGQAARGVKLPEPVWK
ncbi:wd-40 repeat protein : WD40 repeat-containing protein OS=Singulisphaera acidiphila (strain ATCC BAA-1392 / DSM 18658 / VKM B-2454 / MOB10) GN=Sinac_5385 PE=4 SV=1: PSCyt1: WD40: WD40: WD40: WD40 [Gemmata massiliana]|uniref:Cytochrome C Planctomycete-type domain-containing protein n=1 Tax=Gemmata massiliana TaxID=1210884 RepID=A0A6P2DKP8_9BACT|nr:c-type cytochrome domain-containing protein [Gemmata massiliana]VTS01204.1 wd-40 repeat protein : WD40 repeat-containing protein OS=Singulisphaera acidiphila (strain ATCC BAA-1392 / DSM 18658 / VKM B-2454 / MOB10) GN=Sinac_5385 PE=4 SV=1: PSCyt1: WD40: WD40: WD40: WD40 [Gemmata massiliana]